MVADTTIELYSDMPTIREALRRVRGQQGDALPAFPDAHFGAVDSAKRDWRKVPDIDALIDNDEASPAPQWVIDMLGFDPNEE